MPLTPTCAAVQASEERQAAEQVLDIARTVWGKLEKENQ